MLTFICLNNSMSFITINAECMSMLTEQSLCQWHLDLLGVVSFFFQHDKMLFPAVFSQARNPLPLTASQKCSCKIEVGGTYRIISKLLTGEISETSINYNNSLLKTFTQKFCQFFLSSCDSKPVWHTCHTWCLWNGMSISKQQFR